MARFGAEQAEEGEEAKLTERDRTNAEQKRDERAKVRSPSNVCAVRAGDGTCLWNDCLDWNVARGDQKQEQLSQPSPTPSARAPGRRSGRGPDENPNKNPSLIP